MTDDRNPRRLQSVFYIKSACAALLLISFFLPIARGCPGIEFSTSDEYAELGEKKPLFNVGRTEAPAKYAYDYVRAEETTASSALLFLFFGFLWPLPMLLAHRHARRRLLKYPLLLAELCLCLGTWFAIATLTMFEGALLVGGYLALGSGAVYFFVTLFALGQEIRDQRAENRRPMTEIR